MGDIGEADLILTARTISTDRRATAHDFSERGNGMDKKISETGRAVCFRRRFFRRNDTLHRIPPLERDHVEDHDLPGASGIAQLHGARPTHIS